MSKAYRVIKESVYENRRIYVAGELFTPVNPNVEHLLRRGIIEEIAEVDALFPEEDAPVAVAQLHIPKEPKAKPKKQSQQGKKASSGRKPKKG